MKPLPTTRLLPAVLIVSMLAACSRPGETSALGADMPASEPAESSSLPLRLAFMSGHVEAGLALYRAGEPAMAAKHLLHPVSETHAAEREGLDALGFDGRLFESVSRALDEGRPASDIEPLLSEAESNLETLADQAGGDPAEIIAYLLDLIVEEYAIGVPAEAVTDPGEYQDAFGFATVALKRATAFEGQTGEALREEIRRLLTLWPEAPVPPPAPTAAAEIEAQVTAVHAALDATR